MAFAHAVLFQRNKAFAARSFKGIMKCKNFDVIRFQVGRKISLTFPGCSVLASSILVGVCAGRGTERQNPLPSCKLSHYFTDGHLTRE